MDWTAIVAAVLGVYSAALTTYVYVKGRKDNQRQVTVTMSNGVLGYQDDTNPLMLFVEIANPGYRAVTVHPPRLVLPDGTSIVLPLKNSTVRYPHELGEGKKCTAWIQMAVLQRQLRDLGFSGAVELVARVADLTDQEYKSKKPWVLDLGQSHD